jgi:hypothetical protein
MDNLIRLVVQSALADKGMCVILKVLGISMEFVKESVDLCPAL